MHLPGLRDTAETAPCGQARLLRGKTLPDVLLGCFGQMAAALVIDLAIHPPGTNKAPQPAQKDPEARHMLGGYTSQLLVVNRSSRDGSCAKAWRSRGNLRGRRSRDWFDPRA